MVNQHKNTHYLEQHVFGTSWPGIVELGKKNRFVQQSFHKDILGNGERLLSKLT